MIELEKRRLFLIHIYGTGNLLAAIAALKTEELRKSGLIPIIVLDNPGNSKRNLTSLTQIIKELVSCYEIEVINASNFEFSQLIEAIIEISEDQISRDAEITIAYSHEVVPSIVVQLRNYFTNAEEIIFGDALGAVYDKRDVLSQFKKNLKNQFFDLVKGILGFQKSKIPISVIQMRYILILPIDHFGTILASNYEIVPKDLVEEIIEDIRSHSKLLKSLKSELLLLRSPRSLLLLENLADGDFAKPNVELAYYQSNINNIEHLNGTVIIKDHPAVKNSPADRLYSKSDTQRLVRLHEKYSLIPVEFWPIEIMDGIIMCSQYPRLSLKYLFGVDVVKMWGSEEISVVIVEKYKKSFIESDLTLDAALSCLDGWDGAHPLYLGPSKHPSKLKFLHRIKVR